MNATARAPGFFGSRRLMPDPGQLRDLLRAQVRTPQLPASLVDRQRKVMAAAFGRKARARLLTFPEERLIQRITMGFTLAEREQIEQLGYHAYLDRQLDYEAIDDGGLEDALHSALPTLGMSPAELLFNYHEDPIVPVFELLIATVYRSIYSPRQLFERMVILWSDHFNIDLLGDLGIWLKPTDDREVIRRHAMTSFPELLRASAHSPAMLDYLTNDSNVKGHPNENYSRELMELHTLGADRGYDQNDVREVARCFTGWAYRDYRQGAFGTFYFDAAEHDNGSKVVLGHQIAAGGGINDGERVLEILAEHPNTARFVASAMLRYLLGYDPGPRAIDAVAQTYLDTGGDIREMLRVVLARWRMWDAEPKLKRPYHLITSAVRALFGRVASPLFLLQSALEGGHLPFTWPAPNGYPDYESYWAGLLLPRWNFAAEMMGPDSGIELDTTFFDSALPVAELADRIDLLLFNSGMSPTSRQAMVDFLEREPVTSARLREAIGLALASPEFQHY